MLGVLQAGMWLLNDLEKFLAVYGMSHGRFSILLAIVESEGGTLNPASLAKITGRSKATIANLIAKLESDGYIISSVDSSDGRAKRLFLSGKAVVFLNQAVPLFNARLRAMSFKITEEEKLSLLGIISKIDFGDPDKQVLIP